MTIIKSLQKKIRFKKIISIFKNKYVLVSFVFIIWMIFFDQNNLFVQLRRVKDLQDSKFKSDYYAKETAKNKTQLDQLLSNDKELEKFAREKYYMKKADEDVFVIVE